MGDDAILRWTGHPLVDAGVAGLTAFAEASDPAELTSDDLEEFARFAERAYFTPALSGFLTVLFTSNFLNPSWSPEKKREFAGEIVRSFTAEGREGDCTFCARPVVQRASRDLLPLVGGRDMVNFFPQGSRGVPVCGSCLTALQALTVGAPFCSGRALVLSTTNRRLLVRLVRGWVADLQRLVSLVEAGGDVPKARGARTRTVDLLIRAQRTAEGEDEDATLVAYHLSNSGQGPGIDVFVLPASIVGFIRKAQQAAYRADWDEISRRAWEPAKGVSAADLGDEERLPYRNYLYEDLFRLPDAAPRFIRRYFLQRPAQPTSGRRGKGAAAPEPPDAALRVVTWTFIDLFLREVLNMAQTRIDMIRELGDRLAEYIHESNEKRLFVNAFRIRQYFFVRRLLLDTSFRRLQTNDQPMITFDEYLTIFEEGEELARVDWRLAWDLVLIRVIERLHALRSPVIADPEVQQEAGEELRRDEEQALATSEA
jgi:CRISPR-associated protein Cst1